MLSCQCLPWVTSGGFRFEPYVRFDQQQSCGQYSDAPLGAIRRPEQVQQCAGKLHLRDNLVPEREFEPDEVTQACLSQG
jgi:hypothetical protein